MAHGDTDELRLLARLHYGLAVLTALFPLVLLPVLAAGVELLTEPGVARPSSRPTVFTDQDAESRVWREVLGKLAVGSVAAITAVCLVHASVLWYIGGQIAALRRWRLIVVFSALHVINVPLGTALSILTFMVLGSKKSHRSSN